MYTLSACQTHCRSKTVQNERKMSIYYNNSDCILNPMRFSCELPKMYVHIVHIYIYAKAASIAHYCSNDCDCCQNEVKLRVQELTVENFESES